MWELFHGYRVRFAGQPVVGLDGFAGVGVHKAGPTFEGSPMNSLSVIYGFGGFCAALLLAYLVYALLCAEEF